MAKTSGLGFAVSVDDAGGMPRVLSNNFTDFDFSTPRGVDDITGVDKSAVERMLLLADGKASLNGVFDPATNMSHDVFKTVPSTSVARTTSFTIAAKVLAMELLYDDYQLKRDAKGAFRFTAPGSLADGAVPTWA